MQITCTQGKIMVFFVMDMKNKLLAERARYLKENDNGIKHMCRIMEDQEKEAKFEERLEMAAKILESGKNGRRRTYRNVQVYCKAVTVNKRKSCCSGLINLTIITRAG